MKIVMFVLPLLIGRTALAQHPEVLADPADHDAIVAKLHNDAWAREKYANLKARIDEYMRESAGDPVWLSSRLAMNWDTHYTTPVCEMSRYVRGEGRAPIPTPRFAGARDWATIFSAPENLADFRPYNDDSSGRMFLHDRDSNQYGWVVPAVTGRTIESINQRVMQVAEEASFLYWITGDERYARFAAGALMTYMRGYFYVRPPLIPPNDTSMRGIIGTTSFEVIHEDIVTPLALSYDFLYDYLRGHGEDVSVVQIGLKRMIDRVIDGGSREGNWNLNEARIIAYGGLALEEDSAYGDHKGRDYYINIVLNADLPHQLGITQVIHHGFDGTTAMWPEACGYGFGAAKDITLIASLVGNSPGGKAVLSDPILPRNVLAQKNLTYPNGFAVGLGDTTDTRVNAEQLELLIAAARQRGDVALEVRLTSILQSEIDSHYYERATSPDDLVALTKFVGQLKPVPPGGPSLVRSFFGKPLNVLLQRNLGSNPETSLAATIYGTAGGHIHANGLAIELYGAGLTMGADPGRGESYWTEDHTEYYSQPPAHNTVIVNGISNYRVSPQDQIPMTVETSEPAYSVSSESTPALCSNIGFAQCGFDYRSPLASQQRTLALVRPVKGETGFYFDVFRSRADSTASQFNDYLYHDVGQLQSLSDSAGRPLAVRPSSQLNPDRKLLNGYNYFSNEKSIATAGGWHARFGLNVANLERRMDLWMPGGQGRTLFSVDAPPDHEIRDNQDVMKSPMPTIIVRQQGSAWDRPFIAIYEPSTASYPSSIESVEMPQVSAEDAGLAVCVVDGKSSAYTALLMQDDRPGRRHSNVNGVAFRGSFGAVINAPGRKPQLYLGSGMMLSVGQESISAGVQDSGPVAAALWPDGNGWRYSASAPVRVTISCALPNAENTIDGADVLCGEGSFARTHPATLRISPDNPRAVVLMVILPAAVDQLLTPHPIISAAGQ